MIRERMMLAACLAGGALSVAACGWLLPDGELMASTAADASFSDTGGVDADGVDASVADAATCGSSQPFGLAYVVALEPGASGLRLTPDELTGYYARDSAIWRVSRSSLNASFTSPTKVISAPADGGRYEWPSLSDDGSRLYIDDGVAILMAKLDGGGFGSPKLVATSGTGTTNFIAPFAAGTTVFAVSQEFYSAAYNVEQFTVDDGGSLGSRATPNLGGVDTNGPIVTLADQSVAYFSSFRESDGGGYDDEQIWIREGASGGNTRAVKELAVNGYKVEPTWLSLDGCRLYFQRGQPFGNFSTYVTEKVPDAGL